MMDFLIFKYIFTILLPSFYHSFIDPYKFTKNPNLRFEFDFGRINLKSFFRASDFNEIKLMARQSRYE